MKKTRILIVDDHPMMREALRAALEVEPDLEVAGEAVNGLQAVQRALALEPDLIVMDLNLPLKDGVAATAEILDARPQARILVITSALEDEKVVAAVQAGALGYLLKDATRSQFLDGVRAVAAGRVHLPPEVAEKLARGLRHTRRAGSAPAPARPLTRREQELLDLVGQGLSNQAIAQKLNLSPSTVRVHLNNILGKLGLESRSQAIRYALQAGRLPPPSPDEAI